MTDNLKLNPLVKTDILGVGITNAKQEDILEYINCKLKIVNCKLAIVTPNPEMIVYAGKHPAFREILNQAQIALPDGVGVVLAASILGKPIIERITGVDFMEKLCEQCSNKPITVGFLGAKQDIALATANRLKEKYPGLKVGFVGAELPQKTVIPSDPELVEGKSRDLSRMREEKRTQDTRSLHFGRDDQIPNTDILFVAFGFPKQEEWITQNLPHSSIKVTMGVGGAFDYISGQVTRAPLLIRLIGFEWLYRLLRQPWRWKRQLTLLEFMWMVMKAKSLRTPSHIPPPSFPR